MKILYIAMKHDYGDPTRGFSFEHYNFYDSLKKMENGKHKIIYFPFDEIMKEKGKEKMNGQLFLLVEKEKPDLCFFFLFEDEFYKETIKKITDSGIVTFNWFADDHWRFDNFSKYWAPLFSFCSTTDSKSIEKYNKIGYSNILKSQWGCNHFLYNKKDGNNYNYSISFVGRPHGGRKKIVKKIKENKIKIDCFGGGWKNGRVSQEKMIDIFRTSKINLNLTKSSGSFGLKTLFKVFLKKKDSRFSLENPKNLGDNFKSFLGRSRNQIKGRNFEIPGCGGFLMTDNADNLKEYYDLGKEIVVYDSEEDLIKKINFYTKNDAERKKIAEAGYKRTLSNHTYEKRFRKIFDQIGL